MDILASTLRALYLPPKRAHGASAQQRDQQVVAQLDSSLNSWFDSLPDHCQYCTLMFRTIWLSLVRWDPNREDPIFFTQSAMLHSMYYNVQIQIHRPFINKPSPLTFHSLAMCANAARSCSRILGRFSMFRTLHPHFLVWLSSFFFVLPTNSCLDFGIQFWIGSVIMHMGWQEGWFEHGSAQRVLWCGQVYEFTQSAWKEVSRFVFFHWY
jgi:hypothetical protein